MNILVNIYLNNKWIDITNYLVDNFSTLFNYDITFDRAELSIRINQDTIEGVNGKIKFDPGTPVSILYKDKKETLYYTLEVDNVEQIGINKNKMFYIHKLSLVEAAAELRFMRIPNMSFTQPSAFRKSNYSNYRHFRASFNFDSINPGYTKAYPGAAGDKGKLYKIPLQVIVDSNDDGIRLTPGKRYMMRVKTILENRNFNAVDEESENPSMLSSSFLYKTTDIRGADQQSSVLIRYFNNTTETQLDTFNTSVAGGNSKDFKKDGKADHAAAGITGDPITWVEPGGTVTPNIVSVGERVTTFRVSDAELNMDLEFLYGQKIDPSERVDNYRISTSKAFSFTKHTTVANKLILNVLVDIILIELDTEEGDGNNDVITLDRAIDKVINNINGSSYIGGISKFKLDEQIRAKIQDIEITDTQLNDYTAWDALVKLANEAEAIPYLTGQYYDTITLLFRDNTVDFPNDLLITEEFNTVNQEDFVDGYSIDVNNIVDKVDIHSYKIEPAKDLFYTVRAETNDATQITEDNAVFLLQTNIYHPYRFYLRADSSNSGIGVVFKNGTNTVTVKGNVLASNVSLGNKWDVTDFVLEEKEYLALDNFGIYDDNDRRYLKTRGNAIYYKKGDKKVLGLGYRPTAKPGFFTDKPQEYPAVLEMLIKLGYEKLKGEGYNIDNYSFKEFTKGTDLFDNIEMQIVYIPITNTNLNAYKYDAGEKLTDRVTVTSSSDYQTSMVKMSKYMNSVLNEKGNIEYVISGLADVNDIIPDVGNNIVIDNEKYTVNTIETTYGNKIKNYTMTLARDIINQNSNVGLNDEHRTWEIADTNIVERIDKFDIFVRLMYDLEPIKLPTNKWSIKYLDNVLSNKYQQRNILSKHSIPLFNTSKEDRTISNALIGITRTEDGLYDEYILPLNKYHIGPTMVFEAEFIDNYMLGLSVDNFKVEVNLEDPRFKGNRPIPYTDELGRIHKIELKLLNNNISSILGTSSIPLGDQLPKVNGMWNNSTATTVDLSYNPDKDAREKLKIQTQITYIPQDIKNTIIFPAMSKYSPLMDMGNVLNTNNEGHNIGYGYLRNNAELNLTKGNITNILRDLIWTDESTSNPERKVSLVYAYRNTGGNLVKSLSSSSAEYTGIRIPKVEGMNKFVIYNRDTYEVLLYHVINEATTQGEGYSDLFFIPFRELPNYVDELRPDEAINLDINVRKVEDGIPLVESTTFNVAGNYPLIDILTDPSNYSTNVQNYSMPQFYTLKNRATGHTIDINTVVYQNMNIDIVYDTKPKLIEPVVNSINTLVCGKVYLTITNPYDFQVNIYINGVHNYFSANERKTIEFTGYSNPGNYNFNLYMSKPGYTSSNIRNVNGSLPSNCVLPE